MIKVRLVDQASYILSGNDRGIELEFAKVCFSPKLTSSLKDWELRDQVERFADSLGGYLQQLEDRCLT